MAKIAYISDSPTITSGFGVANRPFIDALLDRGHDVEILGVLETRTIFHDRWKVWPVCPHDPLGYRKTAEFVQTFKPDLILMHGDPGTLYHRMSELRFFIQGIPIIGFYPIEGAPIHDAYVEVSKMFHAGFCYTRAGADLVESQGGIRPQVQYLGYDPKAFFPLPEEVRTHIRHVVGFDTYFVVGNHAFNKRTNRHPAIIKAASYLLAENVLFYLHTNPLEGDQLQGWDLQMTQRQYGASNVLFRPERAATYHGIEFDDGTPAEEYLKLVRPETPEERAAIFASLPLTVRYNLEHLYIDPSSVQGFNLPSIEAAACGVPLISTEDGLARSELFANVAMDMFQPDGVDWWHTGVELKLVSPEQIAERVIMVRDIWQKDPERYRSLAEKSAQAAKAFEWNTEPLISEVERQLSNPTQPQTQSPFSLG